MNIAYFINQYPGISHSFIRREIQALERRGVRIARYAIRPSKDQIISPEDRAEAEKTRHIVTTGKVALFGSMIRTLIADPFGSARALGAAAAMGWRSESGFLRHLFYFGEALVLADWMKKAGLSHVHAHFGTNAATIAMLAAPLADATFSFTVHGPEEFEKPALISLERKIGKAAFTAGVSSFGKSQLKKLTPPETWPRIKIVRCGVEKSFYEGAGEPAPSAPHFVCVGRLCAEKGQIDLVEATALTAKTCPGVKVTLIGDGPLRGEIDKAIAHFGIRQNVELAGWKTPAEVREAILASRGFILPSYAEGLPVSIMEALALKRPVIATYIAGIPELVETDACGWLTPAGDVAAIAGAMRLAIEASDEKIAAMGAEGLKRVETMHDIDELAKILAAHFAEAPGTSS